MINQRRVSFPLVAAVSVVFPALALTVLPTPAGAQMNIAAGDEELVVEMIAQPERGQAQAMTLEKERLSVVIDGQHATTTVKQTFHNGIGSVAEGRFRLVAGSGSRVEGFAYWNGEKKIVGEVFEKASAHRVYDGVTQRRRDPGLLDELGDGAFAFKVFPIAAREDKRVEIKYSKWLARHGKAIRYRAPLASHQAEIVVEIHGERAAKNVRSSSHKVSVDKLRTGGVRIRATGTNKSDTFELSYELAEPAWNVAAMVHKDKGHEGYFAVSLAAPTNHEGKIAAKDVTIVLDRSGSMSGEPLAQAKAAAINVVRRLGKDDRVNIVSFDDDVDPLFDEPKAASDKVRKRAVSYIEAIDAGGGTDLALALKSSLAAQAKTDRPQVILFLTDGQSEVKPAIAEAENDTQDARVFAVGLGDGVNQALLSRLARIKRGQFAFIENADDIERDIGRVYRQISRPLLVDVSLKVSGASARRIYPRTTPDLFVDDELLFRGRLRDIEGPVTFTVRGNLGGKPVEYKRTVKVPASLARPWVGRLWAQARVDHLLEDLELDGDEAEKRKEVIELALVYNFVTKFTSFLAIPEGEATGDAKRTLDDARARKRALLKKHADAGNLKNSNAPRVASRESDDSSGNGDGDGDDDDDDDDDAEPAHHGNSTSDHPGGGYKKSGCAGCSSQGGGGKSLLVLLALVALGTRRRRRSSKLVG